MLQINKVSSIYVSTYIQYETGMVKVAVVNKLVNYRKVRFMADYLAKLLIIQETHSVLKNRCKQIIEEGRIKYI